MVALDKDTQREIQTKSLAFHYLFGSSVLIDVAKNYKGEPDAMNQFIKRLEKVFKIS